MKKMQSWLGGLLVLQLALAAGLYWNGQQSQKIVTKPLLAFGSGKVDKLVIGDGKKSVTLQRTNGHWILPDLDKLPAAQSKVSQTLATLKGLKTGWPVATTSASHERFKVAKDKFERRVQLYSGGTQVAELYVGTSPGFRKSHIRKPGDSNVYNAGLNSYDLPVKGQGWLDKSLIAAKDVSSIQGADYALHNKDGKWTLAGDAVATANAKPSGASAGKASGKQADKSGATAAPLDSSKAGDLAASLASLHVEGVVDKIPDAKQVTHTTLSVAGKQGKWSYDFVKAGDKYFVSRNDRKQIFSLSKLEYSRIAKVGRTDLLVAKSKPEAKGKQTALQSPDTSASHG